MTSPVGLALEDVPVRSAAGRLPRPDRSWRQRWRWPLAVSLAVLLVALAGLVLARPSRPGYLSPDNAGPDGTRALVHVLADQGVEVRQERTVAQVRTAMDEAPGATLVLARPDLVDEASTQLLIDVVSTSTSRLVLVEPDAALLADLSLPIATSSAPGTRAGARSAVVTPDCDDPVAERAGPAQLGGSGLVPRAGMPEAPSSPRVLATCYPTENGAGLVVLATRAGQVILLSGGQPLTNDHLGQQGNAALTIGTLVSASSSAPGGSSVQQVATGSTGEPPIVKTTTGTGRSTSPTSTHVGTVTGSAVHTVTEPAASTMVSGSRSTEVRNGTVIWWTPAPQAGASGPTSIIDLIPRPVGWATGQLLVVLVVTMAWRSRRLGRLVVEPLPVVVHAAETTLGRAGLYRRARARGRAAQVLRVAAGRRVAARCGLSRTADPAEVASVVATRTGRSTEHVLALLVGPAPADDRSLVTLARELDILEMEVHRP